MSWNHGQLGHGPGHTERTEKIDLHLILELGVSDILGGSDGTGSCIVDYDVDPAEFFDSFRYRPFHLFGRSDVTANRKCLYTKLRFERSSDFLEFLHTAGDWNYVATCRCKGPRHLHSKASRTTCYESNLPF